MKNRINYFLAFVTLCSSAARAADLYSVTPLYGAAGSVMGYPRGISTAGVSGSFITLDGDLYNEFPATWQNSQFVPLPAGYEGYARGTNSLGDAVGGIDIPQTLTVETGKPVVWHNGQIETLPTGSLPGGAAWAINDSGLIAGEISDSPNAVSQAAIWQGGQVIPIGNFPNAQSWAPAVNNRGQVLVVESGGNEVHSSVWQNGSFTQITSVTSTSVDGVSMNADGVVAGLLETDADGDTPFIWQNGVCTVLPVIAGDSQPAVTWINDSNQVVGYNSSASAALLWENGQVFDLNDLIPANSGWTLMAAAAIDNDGTIVGYGSFNGETTAFELTPVPEPASLAAFLFASTLLLRRGTKTHR